MEYLIEIDKLKLTYRAKGALVPALDEVSLKARQGDFVSIVGPSGCGKTTLLKVIAGLYPPTSGQVKLKGETVRGPHPEVGIVFQSPVLMNWRTALKNIMLQVEVRGLCRDSHLRKAEELVKLVGLQGFEHCYPFQLSGGMQQRVSICRALIHDPPLLLMDEPFGALDAMTREQMNLELLRIWNEKKKTVLFITHSIPEAVFLSDEVAVMSSRPGTILRSLPIDLPRPRTMDTLEEPLFLSLVRRIRSIMQHSTQDGQKAPLVEF